MDNTDQCNYFKERFVPYDILAVIERRVNWERDHATINSPRTPRRLTRTPRRKLPLRHEETRTELEP